MKIWDMLKFIKDTKDITRVVIGFKSFIIIKIKNEKIINDKLISKLFNLKIPLYWFKNEYEFEEFFTYFSPVDNTNFIIIG